MGKFERGFSQERASHRLLQKSSRLDFWGNSRSFGILIFLTFSDILPYWRRRSLQAGKLLYVPEPLCSDGGIGRRSGLKIHRPLRACEFDSRSEHQRISRGRRSHAAAFFSWSCLASRRPGGQSDRTTNYGRSTSCCERRRATGIFPRVFRGGESFPDPVRTASLRGSPNLEGA